MRPFEKLPLGERTDKPANRSFNGVDLGLARPRGIEPRPVDIAEPIQIESPLPHPGDKLLAGAPACRTAIQDEIDETVAAGPKDPVVGAGHGAAGHIGTGTGGCNTQDVDESRPRAKAP